MESPAATSSAGPNVQPYSPRTVPVREANGGAGQGVRRRRGGGGGGNMQRNKPQPPADPRRVLVTGFPQFAQPQDLRHAFASISGPAPVVELFDDHAACLVFSTEQQAAEAIQLDNKAIVYGEFVSVREYTGAAGAAEAAGEVAGNNNTRKQFNKLYNKREFPRSKEKDDGIVRPEQLDLSGEFCNQLDGLLAAVRLTEHEAAALAALYADVQCALTQHMPGCVAMPFGSITTGLGIKTSDADCYVQLPPAQRHLAGNMVARAKRILQQHPKVFTELLSIPRANTPIVKFHHLPTATNCDLSFKTPLGYRNSTLIAHLLHADPRLIPLAVTVKYWAKVHQLTGTGRLSNYALTMCVIFYLQTLGILPSVASLQTHRRHDIMVDGWNTGYDPSPLPRSDNTTPLSDLIGGFFTFYAAFDFTRLVVCPYLGAPVPRDLFKDLDSLPLEYGIYAHNVRSELAYPLRVNTDLCVQDPMELSHNVASGVGTNLAADIAAYLSHAAAAYTQHRPDGCKGLLSAILLHRPNLVRRVQNPEYRITLPVRVVAALTGDWVGTVRRRVVDLFDRLLLIPLTPNKPNAEASNGTEHPLAPTPAPAPDAKKEREKYRGVITAPVWKRKQFNKLYNQVQMEFERKQRRITEEIVHVNKAALNVPFSLAITYNIARVVRVIVRNLDGDPEVFREFGKFLASNLPQWVDNLLKQQQLDDGECSCSLATTDNVHNDAPLAAAVAAAAAADHPHGVDDDDTDDDTDADDDSDVTPTDTPTDVRQTYKHTCDDITDSICTKTEQNLKL